MWHICHIISAIHMAALICDLGVVIHVCHEGCAQSIILVALVAVVAVGKSSEVVGPVGIDGGGGWNGRIDC